MRTVRKAAFVILAFAAFSCLGGFPPEFPAGEFKLKSPITGKWISSEDLKGKPVIIYWFASW